MEACRILQSIPSNGQTLPMCCLVAQSGEICSLQVTNIITRSLYVNCIRGLDMDARDVEPSVLCKNSMVIVIILWDG